MPFSHVGVGDLLFALLRTAHHSGRREHPSCAHRGRPEVRGVHHQQRHADRRQAQVPLCAANPQSNTFSTSSFSSSSSANPNRWHLILCVSPQCVVDENGEPTDKLSPEVVDFCRRLNVAATKVSEVIGNKEPAIYNAIQEGLERVNARAKSNAQKMQKFVVLERDFSIAGGELGQSPPPPPFAFPQVEQKSSVDDLRGRMFTACGYRIFVISRACTGVETTFQSSLLCCDWISCLLAPCQPQHSDRMPFESSFCLLFQCCRTNHEAQTTHRCEDVPGEDRGDVHWSEIETREATPTTYCVDAKLVVTV